MKSLQVFNTLFHLTNLVGVGHTSATLGGSRDRGSDWNEAFFSISASPTPSHLLPLKKSNLSEQQGVPKA